MVEPETDADRFWRFALSAYLPPENRALFLRMQDEGGADVPLALFCLWCGAGRLRLSVEAMQAAIDFSTAWRAARVAPLRTLRQGWKNAPGALPPALSEQARQTVAKAEQAVERLQMDHLVSLRDGIPGSRSAEDAQSAARANLDLYGRLAQVHFSEGDLASMARWSRQDS